MELKEKFKEFCKIKFNGTKENIGGILCDSDAHIVYRLCSEKKENLAGMLFRFMEFSKYILQQNEERK